MGKGLEDGMCAMGSAGVEGGGILGFLVKAESFRLFENVHLDILIKTSFLIFFFLKYLQE